MECFPESCPNLTVLEISDRATDYTVVNVAGSEHLICVLDGKFIELYSYKQDKEYEVPVDTVVGIYKSREYGRIFLIINGHELTFGGNEEEQLRWRELITRWNCLTADLYKLNQEILSLGKTTGQRVGFIKKKKGERV